MSDIRLGRMYNHLTDSWEAPNKKPIPNEEMDNVWCLLDLFCLLNKYS